MLVSAFFHATVIGFGDCTAQLYVNGVANGQAMQYSPPAVADRLTVARHVSVRRVRGRADGL